MVVSKIVNIDRDTKSYFIPAHRHKSLRTGVGSYMAVMSREIPMNATVSDKLMDCFKLDGPTGKYK